MSMKSMGLEVDKMNKENPTKYKAKANGTLKLSSQGIALFSKRVIINANLKKVITLKIKMIIRLSLDTVELCICKVFSIQVPPS